MKRPSEQEIRSTGRSAGRALLALLHGRWRAASLAVVVSIAAAGLSLAQPLVVNRLIETIGDQPITWWIVLLVVLVLATAILEGARQYIMTKLAESVVLGVRQNLISRLLRLPVSVYDSHRTGDLVTRLSSDTTLIRTAFTGGLIETFGGVLLLVGAVIAMALLDITMLLIVLGVSLGAILGVILASRKIQRLTVAAQTSVGKLGASVERALSAIRTVRSR